jgi:hypothetical protein
VVTFSNRLLEERARQLSYSRTAVRAEQCLKEDARTQARSTYNAMQALARFVTTDDTARELRELRNSYFQLNTEVERATQAIMRLCENIGLLNLQADAYRLRGAPAACIQCRRDVEVHELLLCAAPDVATALLICPRCKEAIAQSRREEAIGQSRR